MDYEKAIRWFENIADECDKLTSGNVAHLRAQIKGMAIRSAEYLTKHSQEPASEELEEAANKYGKEETILPEGYNDGDIPDYEKWTADAFKAGAQWDREQMMKNAIEGEVTGIGPLTNGQVFDTQKQMRRLSSTYSFGNSPYCEIGDKVKVIIIKD